MTVPASWHASRRASTRSRSPVCIVRTAILLTPQFPRLRGVRSVYRTGRYTFSPPRLRVGAWTHADGEEAEEWIVADAATARVGGRRERMDNIHLGGSDTPAGVGRRPALPGAAWA